MARGPTANSIRLMVALGILLTLNRCGCEIFTNPFLLREAFLTEGELVRTITGFGIDRNTSLGETIGEFSEEHGSVARLLSKPLEEYSQSANEDEVLHDIASNPIHAFKLIYRLRRSFMGKVLPMIRKNWPKGKATFFCGTNGKTSSIVVLQIET